MINRNYLFLIFVTVNKASNKKTFNFKFENLSALINQNYLFVIFLAINKASNKKTFNFKFENLSFTKLPEKILIRHVIY